MGHEQSPENGHEQHQEVPETSGNAEQPVQKKPQDQNATFLRAARAGNLPQVLDFLHNGVNINTCNSNGLNALHLASKEGHNEVVRELIRRGAEVDSSTRKGNTALHIASLAGQDIIVTILVENGANVNAQSLNGFTPLYMAAQENHENVVRYLLAHGANQALATEDGFTPLAVALQQGHDRVVALLLENDNSSKVKLPALHIAAKKDDTRAATLLLQSEQNPNVTSKSGFTPLHIAAHYGNENVASLLIEKGADVNHKARHDITPLHVAAKWGRVNLCKLLLDNGATKDSRTRDLLTPLHCAARSGHDLVVDLLLENDAPINAKTKNGLAPLHMAAQGDHVECARILLYHHAPVDDVTVDYLTPLHVAAHCGHVQAAKLLLDRHADPNARALNGFTPLHIACKKNRIKVVELLLKYYASLEATTESGLAPLHVASFMGCINIVMYLIQQGAKVDVETVRGETPLHLAARANQTDIVRVLVRNGANVNAKARELQTPLHIACRLGNTDIVLILLNAKADPNAASKDEYTALHIAAKEDKEEVAQILLDHNANQRALTKKGFTPLHLASKYGNYDVAKLLLERGTPVDIEGKNQVTPLHVAAHYNNDRVAQLLLQNGAGAQATAKNGYTPLHIAAKKNQMEIASSLLSYKADPNATSKAGFTPLHLAAESGHSEMSALLLENGSKVNATANNGLTPLHLCAQEDQVDAARVLLANKAEVNAKTKAGYTPLHVACHFGQLNMVRLLMEHGALVGSETSAGYTPLHQAAQQGHNSVVRYLLEHGASPNTKTANGQTPLSIAQRLGYVSVVETLKTVTETTVITETTTVTEERYKPQNPERMNETMFSDSEDEVDEHQQAQQEHAKDFNESITQGLKDSAVIHLIHTGEQGKNSTFDATDADLDAVIKRAQAEPVTTAIPDPTILDHSTDDNIIIVRDTIQPSFLISFLVDARGGAMRGCRHSGVRVIIPPRKAAQPMRITCRYLRKEKLAHPPPLSEGEALASRILEMGPHSAKFLGPVVLEVPHFASLRGREREIVILRSDDGQHWKEHQLEATEDAVQEVLNESFDANELSQLDDLHTSRITRILTNDFPMYFAVVTRVRQEVHCVGPEGGVILSSVVPKVQAIFPDGSLTKIIKVSVQAQPVPNEIVTKLHGNRVAVSPIVTVEPRRRKFHKPITLCIPLPQSSNKSMLTQYTGQPGQEPPTLRLLCSITGGSSPAQWEDITGTTQLTFTGEEVSFTTTVSARFWLMDCQTPRDAARMAQEVYNEAIAVPYMAKFVAFARRPFPLEGQLRLFCMTDDKEDKTLEKQEGFIEVARSRDVEVLGGRHQFLEFAGNLVPITKSGDQLAVFFLPFQENRLAFNSKVRQPDDQEASATGRIALMKEPRIRSENLPPQHPICTLSITLPDYRGPLPALKPAATSPLDPIQARYQTALTGSPTEGDLATQMDYVAKKIHGDWQRLARALGIHDSDIRQIKKEMSGHEALTALKIWVFLKGEEATVQELHSALRRIGRDDIVHKLLRGDLDTDSLRLIDQSTFNLRGSQSNSRADLADRSRGRNDYGKNVDAKDQPDDLKRRDANEEGWTNEDGTESVHKRTVRQITTTESSVKGVGDHPQPNEDTESVSSDSVKDRIARFESLKETAKFPIHRTVESELIEEEAREHSGQRKEEEHVSQRPTELSIQRTAEGKETEAERLNETPMESPSTPQVVTEQREQIGRALTVESPPKSDTQELAEPSPATTEEPQVSVHKLVQKFSQPSEGTTDTSSAAQFPEHHVVAGDGVSRVDSREQIIVREEVEVEPSASTIPETEQHKDLEDIAQTVHKLSVEQHESVQVQPGFGDDIVNVSVQEKIRRLEPATSLESEHDEEGFERQVPEHQAEIGDHDEGLAKAEVEEEVQVRTKPPSDEEFARINQARQEASEEPTEIAGERKTLPIHRALDEEVQDAETGELGEKETPESHLEAAQTPDLSTSTSSSVQQLGAGKSETSEVQPEVISEQQRIRISRTAEQGVVEEDEGEKAGRNVEESHIKPDEEEHSYGKAAAAAALAAAGGFAAAVASSLHDDKEYESRSPTEHTVPSDAPSESDKSPVSPSEREVAAEQSGRTGDRCEEDLLAQTPSESSEDHFTAEGPRSTRSIPIHHTAQGEVVEGQISETHGFKGPELSPHEEEYDTERAHKTESEAVDQTKAHEPAEALATPSDSARSQEPSPIDVSTPESAQEKALESEPLSPRGASPHQAEEELEKEILKREIEPVGDLEKELGTTETVEPVGTEKEISPDESTRQFLDQPSELEAEDVRKAVAHEQEVQQQHEQTPEEEDKAKRKESSPDESTRKFLDQPSELEAEDVREATRHEQEAQQHEQTPEEEDEAKKMGLGTMIAGAALLGGKALYDKLKGDKDQGEGYDGHDSGDDQKPEGGAGKIVSESYEYSYTDDGSGKPKEEFEHHIVAQDDQGRLVEEVEHREPEVEYRSVGDSAEQSPASVRKQVVQTPESQGEVSEAEPSSQPQAEAPSPVAEQLETPEKPLEISSSAASISEEGPKSPPATPTKVVHVHEHYHEQITDKDGNLVDDVTFESNYDTREPSETSQRQSPLLDERKVSLAAVGHDVKAEPVSHFEEQTIHIDPSVLPPSGTQTFHEERVETTEDLRRKSIKEDLDIHVVPKDDQHYQMHIHEERVEREDDQPEKVLIERDYDIEAPSGTEITLPEADQPVENIREEVKEGFVSGQPESDVTESHYKVHEERHEQVLDADGHVIKDTTVVKDYDDENPEPIEEVHEAEKEFVSELERRLSAASSARGDTQPAEQQQEAVEIAETPVSEKEFTAEGPRSTKDIDVYSAESTGLASPEAQKTSEFQQKSGAGSTEGSIALAQDTGEARDREFLEELEQEQKEHEQHQREVAEEQKQTVKSETEPVGDLEKELRVTESVEPVGRVSISKREIEPVGDLEKELRTTESVEPVGTGKEISPDESTRQFLDQPSELEAEDVRQAVAHEQEAQQPHKHAHEESEAKRKESSPDESARKFLDQPSELETEDVREATRHEQEVQQHEQTPEEEDQAKKMGIGTMIAGAALLGGKALYDKLKGDKDQGEGYDGHDSDDDQKPEGGAGKIVSESYEYSYTDDGSGKPKEEFEHHIVAQDDHGRLVEEVEHEPEVEYRSVGDSAKQSPASVRKQIVETPESQGEVSEAEPARKVSEDLHFEATQQKETPDFEVAQVEEPTTTSDTIVESQGNYDIAGGALESPQAPAEISEPSPAGGISAESVVHGTPETPEHHVEKHGEDGEKLPERFSPTEDDIRVSPSQETPQEHRHVVTKDTYEYSYTSDGEHQPHTEVTHITSTQKDDGPVVEHEKHYDIPGDAVQSPGEPVVLERKYSVEHFDEPSSHSADKQDVAGSPEQTSSPFEVIDQPSPVSDQIHHEPHHTVMTDSYEYSYTSDGVHEPHVEVTHKTITQEDEGPVVEHEEHYDLSGKESIGSPNKPLESPAVQEIPQSARSEDLSRKSDTYSVQTGEAEPESEYQVEEIPEDQSLKSDFSPEALQKQESPRDGHEKVIGHHFGSTEELPQTVEELERRERHPSPLPEESEIPDRPAVPTEASVEVIGTPAEEQDFTAEGPRSRRDIDVYGAESSGIESAEAQKTSDLQRTEGEERHRGYEPIAQDEESPEGEDQGDKAKKMGLGTMIAGAAYLGGKAIYDKLKGDKQGYEQVPAEDFEPTEGDTVESYRHVGDSAKTSPELTRKEHRTVHEFDDDFERPAVDEHALRDKLDKEADEKQRQGVQEVPETQGSQEFIEGLPAPPEEPKETVYIHEERHETVIGPDGHVLKDIIETRDYDTAHPEVYETRKTSIGEEERRTSYSDASREIEISPEDLPTTEEPKEVHVHEQHTEWSQDEFGHPREVEIVEDFDITEKTSDDHVPVQGEHEIHVHEKRVEHVVGFGGEDREITTTREYDLHVPEGAEEVHLPDASEPIDQVIASGDEPVHYHVHEERDEKVLDKEGHVLSDVKYVKDFDDEHPEDNVYELKSAEIRGESRLPGDEHQVRQAEEGQLGDVQESSEELENISNASVKDLDIGDGHPYHEARTADVFEQQPIEGLTITERVPINRSPASDIVESEAMSTEHLDISQQPIRENVDAQEVEEGQKIGPATMLAGAAAYGAMKLAEKLRGTGDEQAEEEEYPEAYRRRSETSPVGDIDKETAPSEDPTHQAEPVGSYDESSPCQSTKDYVTRDLEDYELAALQSQEQASPVDEQHEQHVTEPSESQRKTDIEEKEESEQKLVDEIDNEPVELVDDRPYHSSTEEIRPRPHDLGIDAQDNLDLQSPVSIATVRREDTDENLDIMQESIYIPADTPQSESRTPKTDYSYDIEQTPEFASEKYEGHDEEKDPMQQSIYIHHDEEGDQQQAYEEGERSGRDVMEQSVHELYDQRKPPSELVESESIEQEEEYYPDEQHHRSEDIHSETTPVGDLDRETHVSGDIQLETEPVGDVEQQTTPSAPSWKEAEPVGNIAKEVATSVDARQEAEPVVSHQELEGDLEDVVDTESIEGVDKKQEKVGKEEKKSEEDDQEVVESESIDEEKAQKIGLGTMIAGAAYLGGKALYDKLKGDKKEGEDTIDSSEIVESPEDLQSPLRKDSKDEFERKSEISRESSQVLSSDSQITALHVSETDGLVESESLDVETPEEMGSLSPKRRSFEEDKEPLVRSETVEHEAPELPETPTPAKREVEWPKKTAEEEQRQLPTAPSETPSEAEGELVESESIDHPSAEGLESPKSSRFEESGGLVHSETIDESTVLQDTPTSPIHKEPISPEKVGEAFGVHELKEEEGHFEPDVHSPDLVESEEIQHHLQEHHDLPKVLDYTVPRDQEGHPEETGGEVELHEPAPSHKEPISPGKVGEAFGVHELKEEEERFEPNAHSPELVESEEIQHHLQEHHDLPKVIDFTVPRDQEGHPQEGFGSETDTHEVDRQALVESESIDLGAEEPPASPKLSPQKTPVDIISPDEEPSVEEKIRFLKEDEEPETTTGTTEYQDQFRRIDEEHLVESEGIEQSESQPGQITSEKEYLAQKQDSEEDLESPEAYERPVVSAEDQEHHGLVESESIEHPEEPSSVMSESVYEKESPTKESPTKQEAVESKDTRRSFDGTPTTPIRKQSDLILSLDTLQQDIQRQFSQESAGGHELVQPVQEHEEPKIESPKDKKDEFGLTEEEQVEMSALAKAIITSDVPEDIRVKDEPKHDEKVEYEGEDVVESAHIHTLPDEHHFEPSGDIHFIHREEHREGLGSHEQLVESQEAAQGGLEGQQTHKDELSKSVTSAEQRESPQAAEEPYDFDDVEIVESTDLDFEKHDESARQPAEEIYHEEEEEQHEAESPKRQEEDDFDIIQHDDIIDIQMTEEEIAKSEAIRAKDAKAHSFSPRLRGAESPTSTPLQDSELGLGVEESELTHKLEDLERPDLRKVRDIEFERTDSAGSILKDRELTKEDFGGHMPDLSKDSESEDEKPTVERFDQGVEIKIESELDEKHVDFDLVEKEGALAPAEPIGRPQSPIPPRTQSVEQSEASPAGTSKTPESTRAIESVAEEEVGYDGQLEADQNEEAYDLAAKKMEADAKAEISPSNDSGSSNASSTVFVRKEINPDVKMKDSDDGSQSSLLEFERLEQEVVGKQTSPGQSDNEQMVASATGSVNSLLEFENIEREVLEDQINQEAIGQAIGPEVMILSDIREESEVEEMSIKGDDEDSLNEAQIIAEAMITSADSLEPSGGMPVLNRMETSIDSLEPQFSGSRQHHDDSLLDEGTSGVQSQDTQAGMSADTAGTFQEYHDDDRDSLDGALDDYETITTFQTTQEKPDGTTETIIRKVRTRTNDPVHSHVRFTGTESEDRLRNIEPEQEIESVDEEGNITKTIRRTLH